MTTGNNHIACVHLSNSLRQGSQSCEIKSPACPLVSLTHLGKVWAAHLSCYRAGLLALAAVSRFYQEAWLVSVAARPPARALRRLISHHALLLLSSQEKWSLTSWHASVCYCSPFIGWNNCKEVKEWPLTNWWQTHLVLKLDVRC